MKKTWLFLFTVALLTMHTVAFAQNDPQIVGGTDAPIGAYPWMVAVGTPNTSTGGLNQFCGGSLIHQEWVLTAAHCVDGGVVPNQLRLGIGLHNRQNGATEGVLRDVTQIVLHPDYSFPTNDIALLKLSAPVTTIEPVLPAFSVDTHLNVAGEMTTVMGWGRLQVGGASSNILQHVDVPLVSNDTCNEPQSYNGQVTADMICAGYAAGGQDACQGDSGGPLVIKDAQDRWRQVGIVSWGTGCAYPNKYGVYARVTELIDWVQTHTGTITFKQTIVVSTSADESDGDFTDGDNSLREALANANSGDTITFAPALSDSTITLSGTALTIDKQITISATVPITVSGNNQSRVFEIANGGQATITGLTIANGTLLTNSCDTDLDNRCGGGMIVYSGATLELTNSTLVGNSTEFGGAIYNLGTLTVTNSTFSGNLATQEGGGIHASTGSVTVTNSTFANNRAATGGSAIAQGSNATVQIGNSILADYGTSVNCLNTITSLGYNIYSDASCGNGATDQPSTDPLFDTFANHGGTTATYSLQWNSPAIEAGDPTNCSGTTTDQRGTPRPQRDKCDIGAYEYYVGGDVSCDHNRNILDAIYVLEAEVAKRTLGDCPLASNTLNRFGCDVNKDGACTFLDALVITQCDNGINNVLCPSLRGGMFVQSTTADLTMRVGSATMAQGGTVSVTISAEIPPTTTLAATAYTIQYNPALVTPTACELPSDFTGSCNMTFEQNGGLTDAVRISVVRPRGVMGTVQLGTLTFQAAASLQGVSPLTLNSVGAADESGMLLSTNNVSGTLTVGTTTAISLQTHQAQSNSSLLLVGVLLGLTTLIVGWFGRKSPNSAS